MHGYQAVEVDIFAELGAVLPVVALRVDLENLDREAGDVLDRQVDLDFLVVAELLLVVLFDPEDPLVPHLRNLRLAEVFVDARGFLPRLYVHQDFQALQISGAEVAIEPLEVLVFSDDMGHVVFQQLLFGVAVEGCGEAAGGLPVAPDSVDAFVAERGAVLVGEFGVDHEGPFDVGSEEGGVELVHEHAVDQQTVPDDRAQLGGVALVEVALDPSDHLLEDALGLRALLHGFPVHIEVLREVVRAEEVVRRLVLYLASERLQLVDCQFREVIVRESVVRVFPFFRIVEVRESLNYVLQVCEAVDAAQDELEDVGARMADLHEVEVVVDRGDAAGVSELGRVLVYQLYVFREHHFAEVFGAQTRL